MNDTVNSHAALDRAEPQPTDVERNDAEAPKTQPAAAAANGDHTEVDQADAPAGDVAGERNGTDNAELEAREPAVHKRTVSAGNDTEGAKTQPAAAPVSDDRSEADQADAPAGDVASMSNGTDRTKPETNPPRVNEATEMPTGPRKRRSQAEIDANDVAAAKKILADVEARRDRNLQIEAKRAADTNALKAGRELAGELLQGAVLAGDVQAQAVWNSLTKAAKGTRARQLEKMGQILTQRQEAVQKDPETSEKAP